MTIKCRTPPPTLGTDLPRESSSQKHFNDVLLLSYIFALIHSKSILNDYSSSLCPWWIRLTFKIQSLLRMHTDEIYYIMNMKGNNAHSVFILKREIQINVKQGGKCLPNTK